jgi:energy-converting hydrogenase Eha subunit C
LFPVLVSNVLHVIVVKLLTIQPVALTVHVMIILHTQPLNKFPTLNVKIFPDKFHVDIAYHVSHVGSISEITIHVAVFGHTFAYESV